MTLRLFLLSLVTSMGLELPSDRDVSCWAESGRAWATARYCDLTSFGAEAAPAAEPAPASTPVASDRAFETALGEMAAEFAAEAEPVVARVETPTETAANAYCDASPVAGADETIVVGLAEGEEIAAVVVVDGAAEPSSVAAIDNEQPAADDAAAETADAVEPAAPTRADRLASAVRLTREVVQAWAAVIDEAGSESQCGR